MDKGLQIFLTAAATLIGGVSLLILAKIFVEPIHELRKLIGEIGYHVFLSRSLVEKIIDESDNENIKKLEEVTDNFKRLSAKLRADINVIPLFKLFSVIKIFPKKNHLLDAAGSLSKISYCSYINDKEKISDEIEKLFRLLNLNMYGN